MFEKSTEWLTFALSLITGICIVMWRFFNVYSRVTVLESELNSIKQRIDRTEDMIEKRLERIEEKLDMIVSKK